MASSFKIKLKLPPNPNPSGTASSSNNNSPQRSSVPVDGGSSIADGGSSAMSGDEGEEFDELEDSPPPGDNTPNDSVPGNPSSKAKSKSIARKVSSTGSSSSMMKKKSIPMGLHKPVDQMTIEEIEALPAAKRRKSLKARGAAGPGRGWRKGLKMDQKPVYVQPGESPPSKVAPSTPSSFSSRPPKSSLARDALSKTSTPLRSESPYSRGSPMAIDDILLEAGESKPRKGEEEKKPAAAIAAITAATGGGGGGAAAAAALNRINYRSAQTVLPLAKIPIGFVSVATLDKSGSKKPVRSWQRQDREVVSLTGKAWSTMAWITSQQSHAQQEKEIAQKNVSAIAIDVVDTAPSTPGGESNVQTPQPAPAPAPPPSSHRVAADIGPSPLSNSSTVVPAPAAKEQHQPSSPEVDWRGSSAAFSAANKRKA